MGTNSTVVTWPIEDAVSVVTALLKFREPADGVLSAWFKAHKTGSRERAFIAETAYAVLRRKRFLECVLQDEMTPRRCVLATLLFVQGLSQRQLMDSVSPGLAKWLVGLKERVTANPPILTPAEQTDLPDWLYEQLLNYFSPEALLALARALNQPAPLDIRVNPAKATREEVLSQLSREGFDIEPCPYSPLGLRIKGKPYIARHHLYLEGRFEVQDEGSQLLGYLLAPKRGEMVVDFCAGAGGKTLLLGALMRSTGRLYAFDVSDKRLAKLKPRLARSGLSNVHPACLANENDLRVKRLAGKIDRVLIDAPCSGLGTLRRNPDLKWRQTPESIAELSHKQAAILQGASRLVRPGGRIVYATCSLLTDENEAIVDAFLAAHDEFVRVSAAEVLKAQGIACGEQIGDDFHLLPSTHGTDGFYAAVLERRP
ncbi:MAG: RsmB/NOP family class I SAM-dependent RNA methyltransferase [Rhodocyclaceae bacterium]|nr:RsmB/NOP family class I SAM-dependent RNA methyltransferase [Rhodocyclaceae bacterium]